jgi:hypothetical protein
MPLALHRAYLKAPRVVERRIRGELILVPVSQDAPRLDSVYVLDEISAMIWSQAVQGHTVESIADNLSAEFDVDVKTASDDAKRILSELVGIGALMETT